MLNVKGHNLKNAYGKHINDLDGDDSKTVQFGLELLSGHEPSSHILSKSSLENLVKAIQEKKGIQADGAITQILWEKILSKISSNPHNLIIIIDAIEKLEKAWMIKETNKQKLINVLSIEREEIRKKLKDKQNKEANESLNKIESKLIDLSRLTD